jgi:hypothetical protein
VTRNRMIATAAPVLVGIALFFSGCAGGTVGYYGDAYPDDPVYGTFGVYGGWGGWHHGWDHGHWDHHDGHGGWGHGFGHHGGFAGHAGDTRRR